MKIRSIAIIAFALFLPVGIAACSEDSTGDLDKGELIVFAKRDVVRVGEGLALERREGDFRRVFRIPDEVDVTKVEASFEHGVLEVRLPKSERTKPRRISIKAVA